MGVAPERLLMAKQKSQIRPFAFSDSKFIIAYSGRNFARLANFISLGQAVDYGLLL